MQTKSYLPWLFLLSMISTCAEIDMSVPSFPDIAQYFQVASGLVQATISYNFLGFCLGAFLYGPLSDSFGRRKMMLFGNLLMSLGAVGCVVAPSISALLLARFIQGIGASASIVLVFTMIADLYEGPKAFALIGLVNASLAIVMAAAPIIGGFINHSIGWQGNYATVAVFSFLVWGLLLAFLPESKKSDFQPFKLAKVLSDYYSLASSKPFLVSAFIPSLYFAAYMIYISVSAFLYTNTFGVSRLVFVGHQALVVSSFALPSFFLNKITPKFGPIRSVRFGAALSFVALVCMLISGMMHVSSPWNMTLWMCLFCFGFAVCYPIIFGDSLGILPEKQGVASSFIMSSRALLVSAFTGFSASVYDGSLLAAALCIGAGVLLASFLTLSWLGRQSHQKAATA